MQLAKDDPFAFTSNEKLVDTLCACLVSIKKCLSDDAYLNLEKISFSEFQTTILSKSNNLGKRSYSTRNSTDQDLKQQKTGYFKKGMKIIV